MYKIILLILTCKKYTYKVELQRKTWIPLLPAHIQYFYVIGDKEKCKNGHNACSDYIIDEETHTLYTNTLDDYLSLPHKVITAMQAIHNTMEYDYIYKTDDDQIILDMRFLTDLESKLASHHYGGNRISVEDHISAYHEVHPELPHDLFLEKNTYCTGRFYFLSRYAITYLLQYKTAIATKTFEDHTMGLYLSDAIKDTVLLLNDDIAENVMDYEQYVAQHYFIYTECVNCPEICLNAVISYQKYHSHTIRIFLTIQDKSYFDRYQHLLDYSKIVFIGVDASFISTYNRDGHLGTAKIWSHVIRAERAKKIVHFDSDVIFRGDAVNEIVCGLYQHDLVGPVRCYKHNLNGRDDIRHQSDVVATYCFGFNPAKIRMDDFSSEQLISMVRGSFCSLPFEILDFFDPISYLILHHGGTMQIIDFNVIGGLNPFGSKDNRYPVLNNRMDCGDKIIHFSSVGSGINFRKAMKNGAEIHVPASYVQHSFRTLAAYHYLLFGIETEHLDHFVRDVKDAFDELVTIPFVGID